MCIYLVDFQKLDIDSRKQMKYGSHLFDNKALLVFFCSQHTLLRQASQASQAVHKSPFYAGLVISHIDQVLAGAVLTSCCLIDNVVEKKV